MRRVTGPIDLDAPDAGARAIDVLGTVDAAVDGAVVLAACAAIVRHRPAGAVRVLRAAAPKLTSPRARRACVAAIVRLGEDALLVEIAHALRSSDSAVVLGAARVLGDVCDPRAVPNLIEALRTDDPAVFAAVAHALGQINDPVCVPWLVAAVDHGFCVEVACRALGALGDARAKDALVRVKAGPDRARALAAAEALVLIEEAACGQGGEGGEG